MFKIRDNRWTMGDAGIIDTPVGLERTSNNQGWCLQTTAGTQWQWLDNKYGNHLDSLAMASVFALTIGSLEYEETLDYLQLLGKDRLVNTGVLGVFYRGGLRQAYHVILNGEVVVFPYADGRGFTRAVKAAKSMTQPWMTLLFEKLNTWPCLAKP